MPLSYGSHLLDSWERDCALFLTRLFYRNSVKRLFKLAVDDSAIFFPDISLDIEAFAQHRLISYIALVIRIDKRSFTYILSCEA
jgi:hypothetical protein